MKLSVIIVNYNVRYFLEQCLLSVLKACHGIEAEIIVVDNHSVDGSVEMMRQKFLSKEKNVWLIENKINAGFSKANNEAIRIAKGEFVLLLNPDTIVEEDTFSKCLRFMNEHPDAGALGVKMLDGSGHFLPESKRGLPTPAVAFYKITGLSKLFPKSKTFGKYHLGYLDKDRIHEVEVLAGAFMMLRKSALEKTGLLDEDFFMYGEDIDISYRVLKAGYKNYYFPQTRIIHYKGESTKKSDLNYVLVFYNAMIIFARKHFSKTNAAFFTLLIRTAIYLRAAAAIVIRGLKRVFLPLLDFGVIYTGVYFLKEYWSQNTFVQYPPEFTLYVVPAYAIVWILSIYLSGGYDAPIRIRKIVRGLFVGTVFILVVYALLPESYRYSRALILLGFVWATVGVILLRFILNFTRIKQFSLENSNRKKLLIVGEEDEANRVLSLLKMSETTHNFIGFVRPNHTQAKVNQSAAVINTGVFNEKFNLGNIDKFNELISVYHIDEIIFCARDVASNHMISYMSEVTSREVEFKIAPPESMFIIGSNSINNPGEFYVIDINSISKRMNKRNKRLLDLSLSVVFLFSSPVLLFFQKHPGGLFKNVFKVMSGKYSWVGFASGSLSSLPVIKKGILTPLDGQSVTHFDETTINRLNSLYAKDYHIYIDIDIVWKGVTKLGN